MIQFDPRNQQAEDLLRQTVKALDKRKKFNMGEVRSVLSYVFSNRHKEKIRLTGYPAIVDELVFRGIIKRHSGRRDYILAPEYVENEAQWQTVNENPRFKHLVMNRSKAFFRNPEDASTLFFDEVATIGFAEAHFLQLVDKDATLSAWKAGYHPSNLFLFCDYDTTDTEEVNRWEAQIASAILVGQWPVAAIQGGYAVAYPGPAGAAINLEAVKFCGDGTKAFSLLTTDRYGRTSQSYGSYGITPASTLEEMQRQAA